MIAVKVTAKTAVESRSWTAINTNELKNAAPINMPSSTAFGAPNQYSHKPKVNSS